VRYVAQHAVNLPHNTQWLWLLSALPPPVNNVTIDMKPIDRQQTANNK
jgi:hypothetical protein